MTALPPLTVEERANLTKLAEAATPGPWKMAQSFTEHVKGSPMCDGTCVAQGMVPFRVETKPMENDWRHLKRGDLAEFHSFYDDAVDDVLGPDGQHVVCLGGHEYGDHGTVEVPDAAYIAAANPSVLLRLLAQVREAEGRRAWQPIETAPHNGHAVIVMHEWAGEKHVGPAYWSAQAAAWKWCGDGWRVGVIRHQPKFWQPLPPPPTTREEREPQS